MSTEKLKQALHEIGQEQKREAMHLYVYPFAYQLPSGELWRCVVGEGHESGVNNYATFCALTPDGEPDRNRAWCGDHVPTDGPDVSIMWDETVTVV